MSIILSKSNLREGADAVVFGLVKQQPSEESSKVLLWYYAIQNIMSKSLNIGGFRRFIGALLSWIKKSNSIIHMTLVIPKENLRTLIKAPTYR